MKVELDISNAYLANVLCSGIESRSYGISNWAKSISFSELYVEEAGSIAMMQYYQPFVGGYITIVEDRSDQKRAPVEWQLTEDKIRQGIQVILEKYPHHLGAVLADQDKQDALTGNFLIQCSLFGEIKYS